MPYILDVLKSFFRMIQQRRRYYLYTSKKERKVHVMKEIVEYIYVDDANKMIYLYLIRVIILSCRKKKKKDEKDIKKKK